MKHLFLVRHGNYDSRQGEYHLSQGGKLEMERLSTAILQRVSPDLYLLSSSENVAIESARVLAEKFGIKDIQEAVELWSGNPQGAPTGANISGNPLLVQKLVESVDEKDSIILVSHKEIGERYPTYFSREKMKMDFRLPALEKGRAFHFDLEKKAYELIP